MNISNLTRYNYAKNKDAVTSFTKILQNKHFHKNQQGGAAAAHNNRSINCCRPLGSLLLQRISKYFALVQQE